MINKLEGERGWFVAFANSSGVNTPTRLISRYQQVTEHQLGKDVHNWLKNQSRHNTDFSAYLSNKKQTSSWHAH